MLLHSDFINSSFLIVELVEYEEGNEFSKEGEHEDDDDDDDDEGGRVYGCGVS